MKNNKINIVIKVVSILGIIFGLVSLLTPWSYSLFTFGYFSENSSSLFYIDFFTNSSIKDTNYYYQLVFFAFVMIIIFILTILALINVLSFINKVDIERPNTFLFVSSLFIINIILYTTAISLLPFNIYTAQTSYSSGFITAIIAFIIFFILFIFKSVFYQESEMIQETKLEDESLNILKTRYAKGEITKEQFEQMKKDLEG